MELKKYTLMYKSYTIGIVTELSSEWPRPSGTVVLDYSLKGLNDETKFIFDYFEYSIKASYILDYATHEEYCKFVEENENQFIELIDSQEWCMLDQNGKRNTIVIPILAENNELVWTAFKD